MDSSVKLLFVYELAYDIILSCPAIMAHVNPDLINNMSKV